MDPKLSPKFALYSKTVIGAIVMIVSMLTMFFTGEPADSGEMQELESTLSQLFVLLSGLAGFVLTIVGRFKAKQTLTAKPSTGNGTTPVLVFAALMVASLLLVGCGGLFGLGAGGGLTPEERAALTPEAKLYLMQTEFNSALVVANRYAALPECAPAVVLACHDKSTLQAIQVAAVRTDVALKTARGLAANGGPDYVTSVAAARLALAQLALYLTRHQLE